MAAAAVGHDQRLVEARWTKCFYLRMIKSGSVLSEAILSLTVNFHIRPKKQVLCAWVARNLHNRPDATYIEQCFRFRQCVSEG